MKNPVIFSKFGIYCVAWYEDDAVILQVKSLENIMRIRKRREEMGYECGFFTKGPFRFTKSKN